MKKYYLLILIIIIKSNFIHANLCDDIFIQAKDNLAVKVDVRDGQLRINDTGSFRVYLLNTMDRDIVEIKLSILSEEFNSIIKPSSEWTSYPKLITINKSGGKKEYFEVILKRKYDVKPGSYKIKLQLYAGSTKFKTVELNEAVQIFKVPKNSGKIIIDGNINKEEWGNSLLCGPMYRFAAINWSSNGYSVYFQSRILSKFQSRYRFIHDDNNLYCLTDFQKIIKKDKAIIYISPDNETSPNTITINPLNQTIECSNGNNGIEYKFNNEKVEIKIPYKSVNINNKKDFYLNIVRLNQSVTTYWQGDEFTIKDPTFYARLIIK